MDDTSLSLVVLDVTIVMALVLLIMGIRILIDII